MAEKKTLKLRVEKARRAIRECRELEAECDRLIESEAAEVLRNRSKTRSGRSVICSKLVDPQNLSPQELAAKVAERNEQLKTVEQPRAVKLGGVNSYV